MEPDMRRNACSHLGTWDNGKMGSEHKTTSWKIGKSHAVQSTQICSQNKMIKTYTSPKHYVFGGTPKNDYAPGPHHPLE